MTENKPIIIDGVDVSGCKKLDREYAPNYPEIGGYDWFNECKETSTDCQGRNCLFKQLARKTQELKQAEQKLEKIKPILEYYANSYIGEEQLDGTYKYDLGNENCIFYDPRKAKEGLKIIGEVE